MYNEDELLSISALQHLIFCERQCALIHVEQVWSENFLTAQGRIMHERVDEIEHEMRGDTITSRSLPLRSLRLGLSGRADVVEFIRLGETDTGTSDRQGVYFPGKSGLWRPVPVEYKRGKPKADKSDEVQLCAQAICLEEMLQVSIPIGNLFYGQPRRRTPVEFNQSLRMLTEQTARRLHEMLASENTPVAKPSKKCKNCSLFGECMPDLGGKEKSASRYVAQLIEGVGNEGDDFI